MNNIKTSYTVSWEEYINDIESSPPPFLDFKSPQISTFPKSKTANKANK